jgi:predicted nucleotidyltransferase
LKTQSLSFPNRDYEKTLTRVVDYFKEYPGVYAIALTGSMARGKAVEGSCIDLYTFLSKKHRERLASTINSRTRAYSRMGGQVCYYQGDVEGGVEFGKVRVDLSFTDGDFKHEHENSFDITRDELETTVGNLLCYSVLLYQKGRQFQRLKQKYLPFYNDALRKTRLRGTAEEFRYKTWKTKWLAERGEYTSALDALLEARRIFLQHLFIKQRKYPIDYSKWLKEQCTQILRMPKLYQELAQTINGLRLTKKGILEKSQLLEELFTRYGSCQTSQPSDAGTKRSS